MTGGGDEMTSPTEEFIRVFENLKTEVNHRAKKPNSLSFELNTAECKDQMISRQFKLLQYIRDVRNTLQHPQHRATGAAIEITPAFLGEVKALLQILQHPPSAKDIGVPRNQIHVAKHADQLGDLAEIMKTKGFTHLPILDNGGVIEGIFNEASIFDYLWSESERIVGKDMTVEEILPYCSIDRPRTERIKFVRPSVVLEELSSMFAAPDTPTTRVGAVFVTASGKSNEPISRLITPWDALKPQSIK